MSNAVQFLEAISTHPAVLSQAEFVEAVSNTAMGPQVKNALIARDVRALSFELGGRNRMFCAVFLPENDEPNEEPQRKGDDEAPDEEISARAA